MRKRLSHRENLSERVEVRLTKEQRKEWEEEARLDEREYLAEWVRLTIDKLLAKRKADRRIAGEKPGKRPR